MHYEPLVFAGNTTPGGRVVGGFSAQEYGRGVGTGGVRGGRGRVSFGYPQILGGLGPLGLVFFTLENVLCLLFESAIPGGKNITLITSFNGYRP